MGRTNKLLAAALAYAKRGWLVIPCAPQGKVPLTDHGLKDGTTNPQLIRAWWEGRPNANVGLVSGIASGLFVLDVDGTEGYKSLVSLERKHGGLPRTVESRTGGGGRHLFFRHPGHSLKNSVGKLGKGLDVRADGGFVVVPPSAHESGRSYIWVPHHAPGSLPLADAPDWLLNLIRPRGLPSSAATQDVESKQSRANAIFARELTALARVPEGRRNNQLNKAAFLLGKYVSAGALDRDRVEQELRATALEICLGRSEADHTISSGLKAGIAASRHKLSYRRTDLGNAERFVSRHGHNIHYCPPRRKWLVWDGTRWAVDETGEIERKAKETVRSIYKEATTAGDAGKRAKLAKWAAGSESERRLASMISLAKSEPGISVLSHQLDTDPWLLNCLNGTINLRTGELRPHRREDLCTRQVPIPYNSDATCPTWDDFLVEVMDRNLRLVSYLQRAVGYALTGDTSEQVLFLLYGTGANGKSTFLETLKAVLGDYAKQSEFSTFLTRKNDSVGNDLARLAGARFVSATEAEAGKRLSETQVKSVTGGDTVTARFLYAEFFEFRPQFKLFLAANHKPIIRGTDTAIWRRIRMVPFTVTFPPGKQDRKLLEKLRAELPGILAWAVHGCLAWQEHGLGNPNEVMAATASYREEMDLLGGFLADCCSQDPDAEITAKDLYKAYGDWCEDNGERPLSQRYLGMRLRERGFEPSKGAQGKRRWRGIDLVAGVA